MPKPNKWIKGEPVASLDELFSKVSGRGANMPFLFSANFSRPLNPAFILNWSFWQIASMVSRGTLIWGVINPEWAELERKRKCVLVPGKLRG